MYRDSFDKCPRCAIELADAGSARGCSGCGGLFIEEAVLTEMIVAMLPAGPLSRLQLAVLDREEPPLACPTCGEPMQRTAIHQIPIDRCDKGHGAWFDRDELETALRRTAEAGTAGVLVELSAIERRVVPRADPPRPVEPVATPVEVAAPIMAATEPTGRRSIVVTVEAEGQPPITSQTSEPVFKIGRMTRAHLVLPHENVNRMHAAIDIEPERIKLIDLGSTTGTYVNDVPVTTKELVSGDRIRIGPYTLVVTF